MGCQQPIILMGCQQPITNLKKGSNDAVIGALWRRTVRSSRSRWHGVPPRRWGGWRRWHRCWRLRGADEELHAVCYL